MSASVVNAESVLTTYRNVLDSAMAAVPIRGIRDRSDAEVGRAWRIATGDASKAPLTPTDVAWIEGVIGEVRRRKIRPWFESPTREATPQVTDVPPYTVVFHQRMFAPPGVLVEFVVPRLSRETPQKELERIAFAIMRREGGDMAFMYSTRAAFRANEDRAYGEKHPGALERGYLGRIEGGVFHPSTY